MNPHAPGNPADMAAAIALSYQNPHRAVIERVCDLFDGGLCDAEISHVTGYPLALVRAVLRGSTRGAPKR